LSVVEVIEDKHIDMPALSAYLGVVIGNIVAKCGSYPLQAIQSALISLGNSGQASVIVDAALSVVRNVKGDEEVHKICCEAKLDLSNR
jgi:hypothetical protein